ncbi:hypothetical protein ACOSP7_007644 [Xanthoceras sorbifolium]
MGTRNESNTEFHNEVLEILACHESSFDTLTHNYNRMNSTLQTVLTKLQAIRINPSTHLPQLEERIRRGRHTRQQYFEFKEVVEHQRVQLASFHLEGIALQWHRWLTKFKGPLTWEEFTKALLHRFGPTNYEDPSEAHSRLEQIGTVQTYQEAFEKLSYHVDDLPKNYLIGCFIAGLRDAIRLDVKVKQPKTLADTIWVARLIEERNSLQRKTTSNYRPSPFVTASRNTPTPSGVEISFHDMSGTSHPQTIRLTRKLKNREVKVLIDGGSTHNFIDQTTASKLGLPLVRNKCFHVMVGNGEKIECTGRSLGLTLIVQECPIKADFYILPRKACQIVLGVQWLETLGPVETDYKQLTMTFHQDGQQQTFQGLQWSGLEPLESKELL